jgi:CRISPR/Cas system-associated exonuclease Cas4 (RecB family)
MDRLQAIRIIEDTFKNSFDEGRFTHFVRNLFNEIDEDKAFTMAGNYIPNAYKDHIKLYKRIAKYTDPADNELDIIVVNLKKDSSIERARSMQRNFLAWYLKNRGEKDAALVAYYTEGVEDWRFSYVRMEYRTEKNEKGKIKAVTDLTPARRYSFLVGKHEPNHTAQQQLVPLLEDTKNNPTLEQIEQAFNIESVTKEFFNKYRLLFDDVNEHIEKELKKSKQLREELAAKGIDASSFTKKLLGQVVFLYFIQKKGWLGVPKDQTWGKGDRQFLRTLLKDAVSSKENFYSEYLEFLFYEALATEHRGGSDASYYPKFDCKIPFLNGGLFEADYDWKKLEISLPNTYFTNSNKTIEGDIGDGILDVFDRYNFTVKEDEPLEKEVAVDPEMLGKVFENLLEVKDRKSKGAFYTPREIVHYMCQESLINYLDVTLNGQPASYTKLGDTQTDAFGNKAISGQLIIEEENIEIKVPRTDIEELIRHGSAAVENDIRVETKGKETESYSYKLPTLIREHAKDIDAALESIRICDPAIGSGAFPVGMMNEIVQARHILQTYTKKKNTVYDFKRHAIQECIYGVDIDHSAIDIAKLRLWLSLVVDEEDFYKIKPLPNLDYKIVEGNSLIGLPDNALRDPKIEDQIVSLKQEFFDQTDNDKKKILRERININIRKLLDSAEVFTGYHTDFDFRLFFSEVFQAKKGFDIVLGNPPYVDIKALPPKDVKFFFAHYATTQNRINLYSIFIEKGYSLINRKGSLVYINPNSILINQSYKKLRKHIVDAVQKIIKLPDAIFENAIVETIILLLSKTPLTDSILGRYYKNNVSVNWNDIDFSVFERNAWRKDPDCRFNIFTELRFENIRKKIEAGSKSLENYVYFSLGITPYDKYKGHSKKLIKTREYHSKTKLTKEYVPLISGKNIQRYLITDEIEEYLKYGNWLGAPREERFFTQPKIIVRQIVSGNPLRIYAGYSEKSNYFTQIGFSIISKKQDSNELKYLLAIINSTMMNFYHTYKYLDIEKIIFQKVLIANCREFPIKRSEKEKDIINMVNKIIVAKKMNSKADTSAVEHEIDQLVYELYGLTKEEIAIVEGANN